MADDDLTNGTPAQALRAQIVAHHLDDISKEAARVARDAAAAAETAYEILNRPLDDAGYTEMVQKMHRAAESGKSEAIVLRFGSRLCTDQGRAISDGDAGWPDTLPVKARSIYDHWAQTERPLGYHLSATILDYPEGLPGDVGLILDWRLKAPD